MRKMDEWIMMKDWFLKNGWWIFCVSLIVESERIDNMWTYGIETNIILN
jgi:hypothetical protein